MRTLDWRRRKTALSLDDMLKAQRRGMQQGRPYERLLVTQAQMGEIHDALVAGVRFSATRPPQPDATTRWGGWRVEVR